MARAKTRHSKLSANDTAQLPLRLRRQNQREKPKPGKKIRGLRCWWERQSWRMFPAILKRGRGYRPFYNGRSPQFVTGNSSKTRMALNAALGAFVRLSPFPSPPSPVRSHAPADVPVPPASAACFQMCIWQNLWSGEHRPRARVSDFPLGFLRRGKHRVKDAQELHRRFSRRP